MNFEDLHFYQWRIAYFKMVLWSSNFIAWKRIHLETRQLRSNSFVFGRMIVLLISSYKYGFGGICD